VYFQLEIKTKLEAVIKFFHLEEKSINQKSNRDWMLFLEIHDFHLYIHHLHFPFREFLGFEKCGRTHINDKSRSGCLKTTTAPKIVDKILTWFWQIVE